MRLRALSIFSLLSLTLAVSARAEGGGGAPVFPDDPYYSYQTALSAVPAADSSVSRAWEVGTSASMVTIAVIDTGLQLDHPDLTANLWVNSGETPDNGIDDDGNGYIDDVHGYDFRHDHGEPEDEWGHGTLTAGIIGAVGNNGIGTAGVAWSVNLMILKVFGESGGGRVSDFAEAIQYAIDNRARIINASWTVPGTDPSTDPGDQIPLLKEAVKAAEEAGILVVAAAGNDAVNLDDSPTFPAAYPFENVVSVAALKGGGSELLEESNYGQRSVTVAATGEDILGPYLDDGYASLTGTSAATAIVSGIAALMLAENTSLSAADIRRSMIETSDAAESLQGKTVSGGVLNPYASITQALSIAPASTTSEGEPPGDTVTLSASGGCNLVVSPEE